MTNAHRWTPSSQRKRASGALITLASLPLSLCVPMGGHLAGQMLVRGKVLDMSTGGPVASAAVEVRLGDQVVGGPTFTDPTGFFELEIDRAGRYRIRVIRLGYHRYMSEEMIVGPPGAEQVEVDVRLEPAALRLDPLDVTIDGRERGREGFERRRQGEQGHFLDPVHLALIDAPYAGDIIGRAPGLVDGFPEQVTSLSRQCVVTFLDHMPYPIEVSGRTRFPIRRAFNGMAPLDEVVSARDVRGIEVYRTFPEVPDELRDGFRARGIDNCGVILIWTTIGW